MVLDPKIQATMTTLNEMLQEEVLEPGRGILRRGDEICLTAELLPESSETEGTFQLVVDFYRQGGGLEVMFLNHLVVEEGIRTNLHLEGLAVALRPEGEEGAWPSVGYITAHSGRATIPRVKRGRYTMKICPKEYQIGRFR